MVQIDLGSATSDGHLQLFDHAGRFVREDEIFAGQKVLDWHWVDPIYSMQTDNTLSSNWSFQGVNDYTKSGLRVFGFCPAGSTSKVAFTSRMQSIAES